jgi:hypothetical protein
VPGVAAIVFSSITSIGEIVIASLGAKGLVFTKLRELDAAAGV